MLNLFVGALSSRKLEKVIHPSLFDSSEAENERGAVFSNKGQ